MRRPFLAAILQSRTLGIASPSARCYAHSLPVPLLLFALCYAGGRSIQFNEKPIATMASARHSRRCYGAEPMLCSKTAA